VGNPSATGSGKAVKTVVAKSARVTALWFNVARPPMNDPAVRRAVALSIDRAAILRQVFGATDPSAVVPNCGIAPPLAGGPPCGSAANRPFATITYDPATAARLLESNGYAKGPDGYFRRDGNVLTLVMLGTTGGGPVESTQALMLQQLHAAGIKLVVHNYEGTDLPFIDILDLNRGSFDVAAYTLPTLQDPSLEHLFACDKLPAPIDGGFRGGNFTRWCDPAVDELVRRIDQELDTATRLRDLQQLYELEAQRLVVLPLFQQPMVVSWKTDRITGPIGAFASSPQGPFFNMNLWSCVKEGACR
jgi:ABC-type transport system substrate-binding protein